MIDRYSKPEMAGYFTVQAQWAAVREVELAATKALFSIGLGPPEDLEVILKRIPEITEEIVNEIAEREKITDHDVAAFVDVMQSHIDHPASRWFHFALTSSDVTDTGLCLRLTRASTVLGKEAQTCLHVLYELTHKYAMVPTAGRTHGQHAEVITFGVRLANWTQMLERALVTLEQAREDIGVGKLSGACGTYTNIDPAVEVLACEELGLQPIMATQVIPRDLHADLAYACVKLGNVIGHIAYNLRTMASTEFGEVEEGRRPGQKGSSAMPHKKNPIKTEQLEGLSRTMRGYLGSTLEQVQLLFERDISHSAPERIVLADSMILVHYMTVTMTTVLRRLVVKPERMQENIERTYGLMFTQTLLTDLIKAGWQRDSAYRLVQVLAFQAFEEKRHLRELIVECDQIDLSSEQLDGIFDQRRMLRNVHLVIDQIPIITPSEQ